MLKKILVALDGSERSEWSLPWVRKLAPKAELLLVSVTEPIPAVPMTVADIVEEQRRQREQYLNKVAQKLDPVPDQVVRIGSAAPSLLDVADDFKVDLIAITTHGGAETQRRFFGRTTEKLIHGSEVPLLVVPTRDREPRPAKIEKISVPLDGSEISEAAIPLACTVADEQGAIVYLTHIVTGPRKGDPDLRELDRHFKELAAKMEPRAILVKTLVRAGEVPKDLLTSAEMELADLIVMSAHGYGAMKRMFLGSVASELIRQTSTPVLVGRYDALKKLK